MPKIMSGGKLRLLLSGLHERLWVKPLAVCLLSVANIFIIKLADNTSVAGLLPAISADSIEKLLSIMASSMLVIATFAVGSMVAAYASASSTATPRSFALVIADDVSQNALSTFIGAFIFSVVALTAVKNDYFETAGLVALFVMTAAVFAVVILTFLRWVDRIARLGRLGMTVDVVEHAAADALKRRRAAPTLQGVAPRSEQVFGHKVFALTVGYVQQVDIAAIQACAEAAEGRVVVTALPGTFAAPGRPLAYVSGLPGSKPPIDCDKVMRAFTIGDDRRFHDDPRFGLVVLSEIASRALSSAVNDPGTAIDIIGTYVRLFVLWADPAVDHEQEPEHDRVEVPPLSARDMLDDAFTAIARNGAGSVEVAVRLQKALGSLALAGDGALGEAARDHSRMALARAEKALDLPEDLTAVRAAAVVAQSADAQLEKQEAASWPE